MTEFLPVRPFPAARSGWLNIRACERRIPPVAAAGGAAASPGGGVMGLRLRKPVTVLTIVGLSSLITGGVLAASRSSDESALRPTRQAADRSIEGKVNGLVGRMTLAEKLQQLQLLSDGQITDADARAGVGSVFSLTDPGKINHFQHVAVEQSRLHIPILFAYDTIHGYRTIFPVPLGAASSFDPSVATADDTIAA